MTGWWDTALYCDPDPQSIREAEERAWRDAQSAVVSGARVVRTNVSFWRQVEAKQAGRPSGRVRPFAPARPAAQG